MPDSSSHSYQSRIAVHPRSIKGRFRNLKWGVLGLAYGVYFLLPWLRWTRDHGPSQALLFDIPGRKFYIFDLVVFPQDIFWLAGFLFIAAMLLFFVTGLAGRVFCGYFCFQTLWTDAFMLIERLVQGERPARMRLARQPWSGEKLLKLGGTHALWLAFAFWSGLSFTLYWGDAPTLTWAVLTGNAPAPAYITTFLLTATTYVMAGLAREQVCIYMCPYARFQSVMFDKDTLIVSYDRDRGEGGVGRAKPVRDLKTREQRQAAGVGDCVDCGLCVQVCPVGIDIRNGLQYQCIHCALCIDACDQIMDAQDWPRGLVRYTSEHALEGAKTRVFKLKTLGYGLAVLVASVLLVMSVIDREPLEVSLAQVRQPLYVVLSDGAIQNSYEIKVSNKSQRPLTLDVRLHGLEGAELDLGRIEHIELGPEGSTRIMARVRYHEADASHGIKQHDLSIDLLPVGRDDVAPVNLPTHFFTP